MPRISAASVAFAVVAARGRGIARRLRPLRVTGLGLAATARKLGVAGAGAASGQPSSTWARCRGWGDLGILVYTGVAATGGA
jgi:hypothetical protein